MKNIFILLGSLLLITACSADLDQSPSNIASSDSLTDFTGVLNAAYYYQLASVTPMAIMGDFRSDNAYMSNGEAPYTSFGIFDNTLTAMNSQFFGPFYAALYKSILSANNVIENSSDATQIGEAKFLRALSYFKLVQVFGDVTVNLSPNPSTTDTSILVRQPAADVYNNVIIPDLTDAIAALNTKIVNGRASKYAAQGLLGKVYVARADFGSATPHLAAVVNGATAASINLNPVFADIFTKDLNSEIIFATRISKSIPDEYSPASDFWSWYIGNDAKAPNPVTASLVAAFDASPGDLRRAVTITSALKSAKYPQAGGPDYDWTELRLADVILLYAEALNETTNINGSQSSAILAGLDGIRTRAGLASLSGTASTQAAVRDVIAKERRLELAFEGHRWFDLVRTGTAQTALGKTFSNDYYLFPIPTSEVLATFGVITQNPGYN